MRTRLHLLDRAHPQRLQRLVLQPAAVVVAHTRILPLITGKTRKSPGKSRLELMNCLVKHGRHYDVDPAFESICM